MSFDIQGRRVRSAACRSRPREAVGVVAQRDEVEGVREPRVLAAELVAEGALRADDGRLRRRGLAGGEPEGDRVARRAGEIGKLGIREEAPVGRRVVGHGIAPLVRPCLTRWRDAG